MESLTILQLLSYFCLAFALIMLIYRAQRIAKLPIHLRWELYPVPHEKGRSHYGGSFMEVFEWWTKEREVSHLNEIKEMFEEMVFIKALYKKNKGVWIFSFPFHFGLYLLIGFSAFLLIQSILQVFDSPVAFFDTLIQITGVVGIILTLFGSAGLLLKRLLDYDLRSFSGFADYFNLIIFVVIGGSMLLAWLTIDPEFGILKSYTYSLLTASPYETNALVNLEIASVLFFLVYLPFTHMTHFIAKYFTYHEVRWNDTPNEKNSKIEKKIDKVLKYPVSWSASHIKGDGKKTWVDVATTMEDNKDGK